MKKIHVFVCETDDELNLNDQIKSILKYINTICVDVEIYCSNEIGASDDILLIKKIKSSDLIFFLYPKKIVSTCLIGMGYAIAMQIRSIIIVRTKNDLPYLLQKIPESLKIIVVETKGIPFYETIKESHEIKKILLSI